MPCSCWPGGEVCLCGDDCPTAGCECRPAVVAAVTATPNRAPVHATERAIHSAATALAQASAPRAVQTVLPVVVAKKRMFVERVVQLLSATDLAGQPTLRTAAPVRAPVPRPGRQRPEFVEPTSNRPNKRAYEVYDEVNSAFPLLNCFSLCVLVCIDASALWLVQDTFTVTSVDAVLHEARREARREARSNTIAASARPVDQEFSVVAMDLLLAGTNRKKGKATTRAERPRAPTDTAATAAVDRDHANAGAEEAAPCEMADQPFQTPVERLCDLIVQEGLF